MKAILIAAALCAAIAVPAAAEHGGKGKANGHRPDVIQLPKNFSPEGIATSKRHTFFVGSRDTGAIYRGNLRRADEWLHSGRAVVLRYEDLTHDPMDALARATDQIAAVAPERIARAIEECSAENMRQRRGMAKHVRTATVGDSKNHLGEEHFRIFRERYGDLIRRLGYEVR